MKKQSRKNLYLGICLLTAFVLWTVLVHCVDVSDIGPNGSNVGLANLNKLLHGLTGVNIWLYNITDWLGLVPFIIVFIFTITGLSQWIKRRKISKTDYNPLVLGGFYIVVIAVYFLFEKIVINYRPILIDGVLEVSYPSSTTMLVLTVMPTAMMQMKERMKNNMTSKLTGTIILMFVVFMVVARLLSGVHWLTDVIGGVLISAGLVTMYSYVSSLKP